MKRITGREIIDVFERIGELEWYKYKSLLEDNQLVYPPIILWRFKKGQKLDGFAELVTEAVKDFHGKVKWIVEYNGKNWVLLPDLINKMSQSGKFKVDSQIIIALAEDNPEYGIMANNEAPQLAEYIYKKFKDAKMIEV